MTLISAVHISCGSSLMQDFTNISSEHTIHAKPYGTIKNPMCFISYQLRAYTTGRFEKDTIIASLSSEDLETLKHRWDTAKHTTYDACVILNNDSLHWEQELLHPNRIHLKNATLPVAIN